MIDRAELAVDDDDDGSGVLGTMRQIGIKSVSREIVGEKRELWGSLGGHSRRVKPDVKGESKEQSEPGRF